MDVITKFQQNRVPNQIYRTAPFSHLSSLVEDDSGRRSEAPRQNYFSVNEDYGFFDISIDEEDEVAPCMELRKELHDHPREIIMECEIQHPRILCRSFSLSDKTSFVSISIIGVRVLEPRSTADTDADLLQFHLRLQLNEEVLTTWKGVTELGELTFSTMLHIEEEKVPYATAKKMQVLLDPLEAVLRAWERLEELQFEDMKSYNFAQHREAAENLLKQMLFEIYDFKILLNFFSEN